MKVVLKKNLGSRDAMSLGLDYTKCVKGAEVAADDAVAVSLVRRGLATLVDEPKEILAVPAAAEIQAVPPEPMIESTADESESDGGYQGKNRWKGKK